MRSLRFHSWRRIANASRAIAALALSVALIACGADSPTAPSPADALPEAARFDLGGRVSVAPTDRAVASATVEIMSGVNTGRRATTAENGRYSFADLQPGELTLKATADPFGVRTTTVTLDEDLTVDFTFDPASHPDPGPAPTPTPDPPPSPALFALTGTVSPDDLMEGLAGATVEIQTGPDRGQRATTDSAGRYRFEPLRQAPLTLQVSASGFVTERRSLDPKGDAVVDVRLPILGPVTRGRLMDVLSREGLAGIAIEGQNVVAPPSDPRGEFRLSGLNDSGARTVIFKGPGVVERQTRLQVPTSDAQVTLVSSTFNLRAFDQMFRTPELRRWRSAPALLVERRTLEYRDVNMDSAVALADTMSDVETDNLIADVSWALPQLTGNSFDAFASTTRQLSDEGRTVGLLNPGLITIVRVAGLTAATGYWGFGRWRQDADGTVTGGTILLDRDFERSGNPNIRSLRAHELGHALGYGHVTAADSVMHPDARQEPTPFDRAASRIAFLRPPGNRAPDTDPDSVNMLRATGAATWVAAIR